MMIAQAAAKAVMVCPDGKLFPVRTGPKIVMSVAPLHCAGLVALNKFFKSTDKIPPTGIANTAAKTVRGLLHMKSKSMGHRIDVSPNKVKLHQILGSMNFEYSLIPLKSC